VTAGTAAFSDANAGTGKTVTFSGYALSGTAKDNYTLSAQPASVTVNITAKPLTDGMLTLSSYSYTHNGTTYDPTITVTDNAKNLTLNTDYVIDASSTTSASAYGTYTIKVNGIGNYSGSAEATWSILDADAPMASVAVGTDTWNTLLNTITFGKFFKNTQTVNVTASDATSGLQSVSYFTTDSATAPTTADGVEALATGGWTAFTGVSGNSFNGSFSIVPDQKCVIYVKAVDVSGNTTYVSSNGLVLDATAPVIAGVENGSDYHRAINFSVTDEYLSTVTLQKDTDAAQNVSVTSGSASGSASDIGSYTGLISVSLDYLPKTLSGHRTTITVYEEIFRLSCQ